MARHPAFTHIAEPPESAVYLPLPVLVNGWTVGVLRCPVVRVPGDGGFNEHPRGLPGVDFR